MENVGCTMVLPRRGSFSSHCNSNIYTNHWTAPSKVVSVEDKSLKGGGFAMKQGVWDAARSTIEEVRPWCLLIPFDVDRL